MEVPVRLLPMGDAALLVETSDIDAVLAIDAALSARVATGEGVWAQVDDLVPAARTVLVVARPTTNLGDLASEIRAATKGVTAGDAAAVSEELEVRVRYDGPDLEAVASHTGLTVEEVIAAHTETPWRVGFGGFAPGFAYLIGGDPRLQVPRLDSPRTCVPAGSVALAGEFSAIYPRQSPGGWQLIGTTDATLWDADREPPALLVPGMTVRFKDESR